MNIISVFAMICASGLIGIGTFLLLADILKLPRRKTVRAFLMSRKRYQRHGKTSNVDSFLDSIAQLLALGIRLSPIKRERLQAVLKSANLQITPEHHVASCFVKAGLVAILSIPALFIFPALAPVILALSAGVYYGEFTSPERSIKAVRDEIEEELPLFVSRIQSMLGHTRDVVSILESFRKNAGPALARELSITLADMQSGNCQMALVRLETRVGSPDLSDIARGLAAVYEGNDPVGYWTSLSVRLGDKRRQNLQRRAHAVPAKIARLSFVLLICIVLLYGTVILTELLESAGVILG